MAKETKLTIVNSMKGMLSTVNEKGRKMLDYVIGAYEKDPKSVSMADLKDTLAGIVEMMAKNEPQVAMENSVKPVAKATISEEEALKKMAEIVDDASAKKENSVKKATGDAPKKDTTKVTNTAKKTDDGDYIKSLDYAASMPEEFDSKIGHLKVRRDIKDIKELAEKIENGEDLVICAYWNKRQLKQFNYDPYRIQPKDVKSFPNDLDIVEIVYASENGLAVYGVSIYTEIHSSYVPKGFETDEETGLRYCYGVEFQVYEIVGETPEENTENTEEELEDEAKVEEENKRAEAVINSGKKIIKKK